LLVGGGRRDGAIFQDLNGSTPYGLAAQTNASFGR
jgi:hypothetical protein